MLQKSNNGRFFKKINKNLKATNQVIGKSTMGNFPKAIAEYLQIENTSKQPRIYRTLLPKNSRNFAG